jgi:hypothetical protein
VTPGGGDTGRELEKVERALATALQPLAFTSLLAQREIDRAHDRAVRGGTHGDYVEASAALLATLDTVIGELEPALVAASNRLGEIP